MVMFIGIKGHFKLYTLLRIWYCIAMATHTLHCMHNSLRGN